MKAINLRGALRLGGCTGASHLSSAFAKHHED